MANTKFEDSDYFRDQVRLLMGAGSLKFSEGCNVSHGKFWTVDEEYGEFYVSFWAKPTVPNTLGYGGSDGAGGQHNFLGGFQTNSTHAVVTGNIWDAGVKTADFASCDEIPLGDWVHVEFVYNGTNLFVLINGVCSWFLPYTGVRSFQSGGSDGGLYVGGSFHNNMPGNLKCFRIVEGDYCGINGENRYVPRDYNGYIVNGDGSTLTRATFAADYSVSGMRSFLDMGEGFESRIHHGSFTRYDAGTPFPTWEMGEVEASAVIPTAPSTPVGALVFDSFSRENSLEILDNVSNLGSTEAGSLGQLEWQTIYFDGSNRGAGVLYGRAVIYSIVATAWVLTDRTNVDIRVTRPAVSYASTGILARFKDADNYYRIIGNDTSIGFEFRESGSTTFPLGFTVTGGWSVLRVVMNGTTMSVYTDGNLAGTKTVVNDAGALNHGMYAGGSVNRFDDFTILAV